MLLVVEGEGHWYILAEVGTGQFMAKSINYFAEPVEAVSGPFLRLQKYDSMVKRSCDWFSLHWLLNSLDSNVPPWLIRGERATSPCRKHEAKVDQCRNKLMAFTCGNCHLGVCLLCG